MSVLSKLLEFTSPQQRKRAFLAAFVGAGGLLLLRRWLRQRQGAAKHSSRRTSAATAANGRQRRIAIDAAFFRRLGDVLRLCIPSWKSREALAVFMLSVLLVVRTGFSLAIAEVVGDNAQNLVNRQWAAVARGVGLFFLLTVPATFINSSLKFLTSRLSCMVRSRLSDHVNQRYISGVTFYTVCNLPLEGDAKLENVDQRVTVDIANFSDAIAELYTNLFKPSLDIFVFTYKLSEVTGWMGPAIMYGYFVASGYVKQLVLKMARLGSKVKQSSHLEGKYRTAHQRLITNSEEIAFYGGSTRERRIISDGLGGIMDHERTMRRTKFWVDVGDNFLIKYWATMAGYATMAVPLALGVGGSEAKTASDLTRDYARLGRYLNNLSDALQAFVLLMNKLATISGYTSRVTELLDKIDHLHSSVPKGWTPLPDDESNDDKRDNDDVRAFVQQWRERRDAARDQRVAASGGNQVKQLQEGGTYIIGEGNIMKFDHVDIVSPEQRLLVRDLNFEVDTENVMVTGPNGAGKSSLFRIIGELWPLSAGTLTKPTAEDILFVPQKPYLVMGTLRDQIIYPHSRQQMEARGVTDEDLASLLAIADPSGIILSQWNWDTEEDWFHAFSGGQKQRIAMSRLFYHRPKYAILDECTSAVSSEVEDELYGTCKRLGITLFTVSHREYLKRHHDFVLTFLGEKGMYTMERISGEEKQRLISEYQRKMHDFEREHDDVAHATDE